MEVIGKGAREVSGHLVQSRKHKAFRFEAFRRIGAGVQGFRADADVEELPGNESMRQWLDATRGLPWPVNRSIAAQSNPTSHHPSSERAAAAKPTGILIIFPTKQ